MNLYASLLGKTAVDQLTETARSAVLQIGSDHLTRSDLARVGCFNFLAAKILSRVLHDELSVKNLRHVYDTIPPSALALPHLGVISLAVLGAAFEAKGIGGAAPLESYVRRHTRKDGERVTTFSSLKRHDQEGITKERQERKKRKAQRRDQAHQLRKQRFDQRSAS
jgi:hypothetical protein